MAFIGDVVKAGFGVVGKLLFGGGKAQPAAQPGVAMQPVPTRNAAAEVARREAAIRKRRGARSNDITGGAEPVTPAAKTLLGQ